MRLSLPGSSRTGTNPEQLLAVGWSACFLSTIKVASRMKLRLPADIAIDTEVDLGTSSGGYFLQAGSTCTCQPWRLFSLPGNQFRERKSRFSHRDDIVREEIHSSLTELRRLAFSRPMQKIAFEDRACANSCVAILACYYGLVANCLIAWAYRSITGIEMPRSRPVVVRSS